MVYVIGITGPSGSGKSTLARSLLQTLGDRAVLLVQDDYYRDLGHLPEEARTAVDFDDPAAVELELLAAHLAGLRRGRSVECPVYDFAAHTRVPGRTSAVEPRPFVIVEGLLLACREEVREQLDLLVYVDAPDEERLNRRVDRDGRERGRTRESVERQWEQDVVPATGRFIIPLRREADMVVDGTGPTEESVERILVVLRRDTGS